MATDAHVGIDQPVLEMAGVDEVVSYMSRAVEDALHVLSGLWADVGMEPEERLQVCRSIILDVDRALQAKISDARESKAQTVLKIRLTHRRMKAIYAQLGIPPPNTDFACGDDASAADHPGASCDAAKRGDAEKTQMGLRLQLEKLEQMLEEADAKRSQRLEAFTSMAAELCGMLLEQYGPLDEERQGCLDLSGETDLSDAREQLLLKAISAGKAARDARARDIMECVGSMRALWEVLGSDEDQRDAQQEQWMQLDAEVQAGGTGLHPSAAVLKSAKERLESLQILAEVRQQAVAALVSSLELLWRRVETPSQEQDAYKRQHTGITLQDIRYHEATLAELEKKLDSMLPALINASTARLETLQKALLEQESPTSTVDNAAITVAALEKLEAEIESAEARLEQRQGVLTLLERRDAILKEAAELKSAGQDPSRLLDKSAGSFRARQQEEKRRNMVSKELPRVTEKLRKTIADWEQGSGEPFVYLGRKYSDIMEEQRLEEERELEEERLRREEERQRIKAKRSGVCAPPASSPCLAGMSTAMASATPKGGACAANHTPKGPGGKTPLDRARASVPPKSPAAHHRSTPASSAGAKSGADRAGTAGKENADTNNYALGTSQSAASRRGLFATPVSKDFGDAAGGGAGGAGGLGECVCTPTAENVQKGAGEMESPAGNVRRDEGVVASAFKYDGSANKSEAVQSLEQRLALARQQITPKPQDADAEVAAAPASAIPSSKDPEIEPVQWVGLKEPAQWAGLYSKDAVPVLEGGAGKGMEQGHAAGVEMLERTAINNNNVNNSNAVPFARWIASGCPIGTKSRVSGVCMETQHSTPLEAVRESSSEGVSSSSSTGSLTLADLAADGSAQEGEEEEEEETGGAGTEQGLGNGRGGGKGGGGTSSQMVHDYLGDRYYTDEERVEIRRELLKEMDERKDELEAAVEKSSRIRFKKGEVLGAGSFGQVFLGLNEATGELLAVKEVDCSRAGEAAITSLEAEIEMLQLLRHPNIVAYYGVQRHAGVAVLVEYCAGGSIASVISNFGALNEQVVRSYTRQILQGLDYLHKHCIVHRDVKCANVLLDSDGNVKVADFGASKNLSQINGEGHQMSMKGTPFFMAPEVVLQQVILLSLSLSLSLSVCLSFSLSLSLFLSFSLSLPLFSVSVRVYTHALCAHCMYMSMSVSRTRMSVSHSKTHSHIVADFGASKNE
jgi:hypothetical protein